VMTEAQLTPQNLTQEIFSLLDQPREIQKISANARALSHPGAAREIVDLIETAARRASRNERTSP